MDNLQRLIQLAKADGGKFFIIDEFGDPKLVIMGIEEYEGVLLHKVKNQVDEVEEINEKIIQAQKEEQAGHFSSNQDELKSEVIDSTFSFEGHPNQNELEEI